MWCYFKFVLYTLVCSDIFLCRCVLVFLCCIFACMCGKMQFVCMHVWLHVYTAFLYGYMQCICMHTCMTICSVFVCMYDYMQCICMHTCMTICSVFVHRCVCVCTLVCVFVHRCGGQGCRLCTIPAWTVDCWGCRQVHGSCVWGPVRACGGQGHQVNSKLISWQICIQSLHLYFYCEVFCSSSK